MNLYAVVPQYAPEVEVGFLVQRDDQAALQVAKWHAAQDTVNGYGSPRVGVYLVAELRHVGDVEVTDIVDDFPWARDAITEVMAREVIHAEDARIRRERNTA